jgi:hypothetical protein
MADGKLPFTCDVHPHVTCHCFIRMQGAMRDFCALHGYRSNVWPHGRYSREGPISVRPCSFVTVTNLTYLRVIERTPLLACSTSVNLTSHV